jgi:hypothetical protein
MTMTSRASAHPIARAVEEFQWANGGTDGTARSTFNRFEELRIKEMRRQIAQMVAIIVDLEHSAKMLESEIKVEENGARIWDSNDFAYPLTARTMSLRRRNLMRSIMHLKGCLEETRRSLADALLTVHSDATDPI